MYCIVYIYTDLTAGKQVSFVLPPKATAHKQDQVPGLKVCMLHVFDRCWRYITCCHFCTQISSLSDTHAHPHTNTHTNAQNNETQHTQFEMLMGSGCCINDVEVLYLCIFESMCCLMHGNNWGVGAHSKWRILIFLHMRHCSRFVDKTPSGVWNVNTNIIKIWREFLRFFGPLLPFFAWESMHSCMNR